jgi:HK97 family phage major capsid protein
LPDDYTPKGEISMNINQMVIRARADVERLKTELRTLIDGKEDFTDAEAKRSQELTRKLDIARGKLAEAEQVQAEEADFDRRQAEVHPSGAAPITRATADVHVTREPRTYAPHNDPEGKRFLRDIALGTVQGDRSAIDRLDHYVAEERVERPGLMERAAGDATTASFGVGLIVPQYLTELYAPAVANMRPLANVVNHHVLPEEGMTLNLSKITTATSAAIQASQLTPVSSTSIAETDLAIAVQTAAGSQNVSLQAIQRGTGIEDVTMQDLLKRVATIIDFNLINQTTNGIDTTSQTVSYVSASPTGQEFWPYIFKANSVLESTLLNQAAVDYMVMHPRRWNWLCAQVGSTWPILGSQQGGPDAQQFAVQVTNQYGANVRGVLNNGLKVVVDANVPVTENTNQDPAFVLASQECHLWEPPSGAVYIRAEQPSAASLGVLLVAYEFFAFTNVRYANAQAKIIGTGMAAPAGF